MKFSAFLIAMTLAASALAVNTSYWTQTNEADFKSGTLENVVASNLGDVKLSRAVKVLLDQDPRISSVNALAEAPDGTIYAGTGPRGVLLSVKNDSVSTVAQLGDATQIFSVLIDSHGSIIVGTGGNEGRVLKIDKPGDKPHEIFKADKVQYIWSMAQTDDGNLYAATGPNGQLFEIHPDGSHRVLLDTDENNLLSMVSDGKDLLYVGTDPHGMVYRVNRKNGESFVLYNATESEIAALALDRQGNLYAATAEAQEEGVPVRMPKQPAPGGRPEGAPAAAPLPGEHPKEPAPPPPPSNDPNRPNPIPRTPRAALPMNPAHFAMDWRPVRNRHVVLIDDPAPGDPSPRPPRRRPSPNPNPSPEPAPGGPQGGMPRGQGMQRGPLNPGETGEARPEGNAVYRIDPNGFVTEVFRQDVLILSMVENNGTLLLATGNENEGQIFQVRPAADETLMLAKVDAKQVLALLPARDGRIYMGMANAGSLASMSSGFATHGTYSSAVLDATQISRYGKIQLHGSLPPGTTLTVATRSGNVKDATEKGWSKWSDEMAAAEFLQIASPPARFFQYRLTFTSTEGHATPIVEDVTIAYQIPNLPPRVRSVRVASAGGVGPGGDQNMSGDVEGNAPNGAPAPMPVARRPHNSHENITWEASDPNNDTLTYSLYLRRVGEEPWILLKDKLTDTNFDWETRTVADGRYEVKVVASDAASNEPGQGKTASRISDPVLVDNTPPTIGDIKSSVQGSTAHVELKAVDRTSTVASVEYCVDSGKEWQLVLPTDGIYDSPEETVKMAIPDLSIGQHQITLRATDIKGNTAYETVFVTVPGQALSAKPAGH